MTINRGMLLLDNPRQPSGQERNPSAYRNSSGKHRIFNTYRHCISQKYISSHTNWRRRSYLCLCWSRPCPWNKKPPAFFPPSLVSTWGIKTSSKPKSNRLCFEESGKKKNAPKHNVMKALRISSRMNFSDSLKVALWWGKEDDGPKLRGGIRRPERGSRAGVVIAPGRREAGAAAAAGKMTALASHPGTATRPHQGSPAPRGEAGIPPNPRGPGSIRPGRAHPEPAEAAREAADEDTGWATDFRQAQRWRWEGKRLIQSAHRMPGPGTASVSFPSTQQDAGPGGGGGSQ